MLFGTVAKNKWGINFEAVSCPRCGTPRPKVRKPGCARQALWDGYTCSNCGAEEDKWGREEVVREGRWNAFFNRPGSVRQLNLAVGAMFFAFLLWIVFEDHVGFVIDGVLVVALVSWILKFLASRKFF